MTYTTREQSNYDAAPIELYLFRGLDGTEYAYTSHSEPIVRGATTFRPITLQRNALKAGTQEGDNHTLEITLPAKEQMILDYATRVTPPKLDVTIYRFQAGDDPVSESVIYWLGPVSSFKLSGDVATVRSTSIFGSALSGNVPSVYFQSPCNWVLYSEECGAAANLWTVPTTVVEAGTNTVEVASLGSHVDTDFLGGEVACPRTGERRMVVGVTSTVFSISYPFADLRDGDDITLRAGCDHSFETCKNKFNNSSRFGGHRFIPWVNPFVEGID